MLRKRLEALSHTERGKTRAQGVAELRNMYGSGHGKSYSYQGLEPRHAQLAVGSSITLVRFMWDTYKRNLPNASL